MAAQPVLVDHVVIVSLDVDDTCQRLFYATGLASIAGGVHEGLGTANRIVPLGTGYLEILAVDDATLAALNPFGQLALAGAATARDSGLVEHLAAWSACVPSVERAAEATGGEVMALSRAGVSVRLTGIAEATVNPSLPFMLQRAEGQVSPESRNADHRVQPTGVARLIASSPTSNLWAEHLPLGATEFDVTTGDAALLSVEIAFADGTLTRLTAQSPTGEV
ncbi:MAG: VOC family protein [Actinomycetes bacterium]